MEDAFFNVKASLDELFSLQRCFCLRKIIPGWTFLFAEMLLPPQNNPGMSVSPCRDASASAK